MYIMPLFLSSANKSKSLVQFPLPIRPAFVFFSRLMCLTGLSFTAVCCVKSHPLLWREPVEKEGKRGRCRNEQRSDLSFQVVAPLGCVMAIGSSKCLPSVINAHRRWTHTTALCLNGVQLWGEDHGSIWACEWGCLSAADCAHYGSRPAPENDTFSSLGNWRVLYCYYYSIYHQHALVIFQAGQNETRINMCIHVVSQPECLSWFCPLLNLW